MRVLYIVTYDICNPKRLRDVLRLMRGYGDHLQFSVFRCELSDRETVELMAKLHELVKHGEDQVLLFPLGPVAGMRESAVHSVGRPYVPVEHGAVII